MMNCERVRQLLSGEHDGRPAGRKAGAVAAHLETCPACLEFRNGLRAICGRLRELEQWPTSAAPALMPRILARWRTLQPVPAPARRRRFVPIPVPARRSLLGALALALLALVLSRAAWQGWWHGPIPTPRIVRRGSPAHPVLPPVHAQRLVASPPHRPTSGRAASLEEATAERDPGSPAQEARNDQQRPAAAAWPGPAVDDL